MQLRPEEARLPAYTLLDSGGGFRLERFAGRLLSRPDPTAIWSRRLPEAEWQAAEARFDPERRYGTSHWEIRRGGAEWDWQHDDLRLRLKLTPFKHTGLFPEQEANWRWTRRRIRDFMRSEGRPPRLLSLFAYTGAGTLSMAAEGAEVCHVDASKDVVAWARRNQAASGLEERPVRWIVDDCEAFLRREARRGRVYDGAVLDPPAYGRDRKGKVFRFESHVPGLLEALAAVLSPSPLFLVFNAYSMGYSAPVIANLLRDRFDLPLQARELLLREEPREGLRRYSLPCSLVLRAGAGLEDEA